MSQSREVAIRKKRYFDSVFLMAVARRLGEQSGVRAAAAVMGTPANKRTLVGMGFRESDLNDAGPNDLVVVLEGDDETVRSIAGNLEEWLTRPKQISGEVAVSFADALSRQGKSNLAVISVPGQYAAQEADNALEHGLNVFLFSDHVSVDDEIALKRKARASGLIVMGPDCGTALVAGTCIGFANVVRRGPIGVVASSGTGLQEFTCLVHRAGSGISHGLGIGSRDLSDDVGGLAAIAAIDALEADAGTKVIAVISKPPGKDTLKRIAARLADCAKPSVACFLGLQSESMLDCGQVEICPTLDDLSASAMRFVGATPADDLLRPDEIGSTVADETRNMAADQRYVRGLFAGGTFCYQSQQVFRDAGIIVHSNAPLAGMRKIEGGAASRKHSLIDMGADEFTIGTPHPMIDATQRVRRIGIEGQDPTVAVLLLDIILGYNASRDPAGDLAEAIASAKRRAVKHGRHLSVVASVCGTDGDPQGIHGQESTLRDAGVIVFPSNAQATKLAREIILQR